MERIKVSASFSNFLYDNKNKNKVANVLCLIIERHNYTSKLFPNIVTVKDLNYLTLRSDGTISYLPAGKELKLNESGDWSREGRQFGKPAKVIRKLFTDKAIKRLFTDKDFENFANAYKAESDTSNLTFKLLPAKKIPEVYSMDRVESGTLGGSCMNDYDDKLEIYANCKDLQILTLLDKEGKLNGRALVWNVDKDLTFMDRLYVAKDHYMEMFLDHAAKQKWYRKKHYNSWEDRTGLICPEGNYVTKVMKIITSTDFERYPYIDTFAFGGDGYLSNNESGAHKYSYNNTGGSRDEDHSDEIYDEIDGNYIDESDAINIDRGEYEGNYTHIDNTVRDRDGNYWWREDSGIVQVGRYWYAKDSDYICYVDRDNEYYLASDCVYSENEGEYILENESVEIDGEYYHEDSEDIEQDENGDWKLKD